MTLEKKPVTPPIDKHKSPRAKPRKTAKEKVANHADSAKKANIKQKIKEIDIDYHISFIDQMKKENLRYGGLDFSLNGTGIATMYRGKTDTVTVKCSQAGASYALSTKGLERKALTFNSSYDRLEYIESILLWFVQKHKLDVLFVEDFSYNSVGKVFQLSEGCGAVLFSVAKQTGIKVFKIPPTLIKSEIAGHGHAKKELVEKAVKKVVKDHNYKTDNESDAMAVLIVGYELFNKANPKVTKWK
jgi:Holliday junction resolvasome RuvABC endonuclease subunit